jgi:hypothetical protein
LFSALSGLLFRLLLLPLLQAASAAAASMQKRNFAIYFY